MPLHVYRLLTTTSVLQDLFQSQAHAHSHSGTGLVGIKGLWEGLWRRRAQKFQIYARANKYKSYRNLELHGSVTLGIYLHPWLAKAAGDRHIYT
jgi:hypothetical protein